MSKATRSKTSAEGMQLNEDTMAELRKMVQEEVGKVTQTIQSEVQALGQRIGKLESQVATMSGLTEKMESLEQSVQYVSDAYDHFKVDTIPALMAYIEAITTGLARHILDMDVHRRKWSLIIQGLPGPAGESEAATRQECTKFAREYLGIRGDTHIAACHRLRQARDAPITIRFCDLAARNAWLDGAKGLRNRPPPYKVSISPDLPPVLRPLKKDLMRERKALPDEQRQSSSIRHLREWPYVELKVRGEAQARAPGITWSSVTKDMLGVDITKLPVIKDSTT